jgi:hypothetical protein
MRVRQLRQMCAHAIMLVTVFVCVFGPAQRVAFAQTAEHLIDNTGVSATRFCEVTQDGREAAICPGDMGSAVPRVKMPEPKQFADGVASCCRPDYHEPHARYVQHSFASS